MVHRLKLMWDYDAFPIWSLDRGGMMTDVPISDGLRDELQAWSDEWTALMWGSDGPDAPDSMPPSQEQYDRWNSRGRELLRRLTDELGYEYEVVFWEEPVCGGDEEE